MKTEINYAKSWLSDLRDMLEETRKSLIQIYDLRKQDYEETLKTLHEMKSKAIEMGWTDDEIEYQSLCISDAASNRFDELHGHEEFVLEESVKDLERKIRILEEYTEE